MLIWHWCLILPFYFITVIFFFIFLDDFSGITVNFHEWLMFKHKICSFIPSNTIPFWAVILRWRSLKPNLAFRNWLWECRFFRFWTFNRHVRLNIEMTLLNWSPIKVILVSKHIRGRLGFCGEAVTVWIGSHKIKNQEILYKNEAKHQIKSKLKNYLIVLQ